MAQSTSSPAESSKRASGRVVLPAVAVAFGIAALLVGTAGDYGLTLDEPIYIGSAGRLADWFADTLASGPGRIGANFRDERLQEVWAFARPQNYNLPVPVLLSCVGHQISRHWLSPLVSYRFGHCLLMAATVGVLFGCLASSHGWQVACVSAGSLLGMPHVFVHAHLNTTDAALSCFWVLTILGWLHAGSSWRGGLLPAIACGLGLATKATFVLLPPLLMLWLLLFRRWAWWRAAVLICLLSPLVMLLFCPMWWAAPLSRGLEYFRTVFRADEVWKIEVYYLGQTYIAGVNPIPWHNGLVLPAVTTPPWTLLLALLCAVQWIRLRDARTGLWSKAALVLPFLRMLPNTPAHDGVRLMLPSICCLAPLAGFGFAGLVDRIRVTTTGPSHRVVRWLLVVLLLAGGAVAVVSMHPYEMSYYSEGIGGLAGASRLGFEVSYWFDALTPTALEDIQQHLPPGSRVWTFPRYDGYPLLREWGLWRPNLVDADVGQADYLLLYSRKSRFYAIPGIEQTYERGQPLWSLECRGVQIIGLYRL